MKGTLMEWGLLSLLNLVVAAGALPAAEGDAIELNRCAIVADPDSPGYVRQALGELVGYLREITGSETPVLDSAGAGAALVMLVGAGSVRQAIGEAPPADTLGEEGFQIRSLTREGRRYLVVAGAHPQGTRLAILWLMRMIRAEGNSALLPGSLDLVIRPRFARRGMHLNGWSFNHPYSFRRWSEEEWKRYLDLLACQGVNLFYLWPFMEIIPVPLSAEDEAYLQECRRVVEYAQQAHGMEVWIMQCTNRVARDRCGVADPRYRPYWRPAQEDLDPGNPEHLEAILQSREALYRIVNNVDGVCNIDSDPGYCPGSPLADYLTVLQRCRSLLDRHNIHGSQTRLINWMWMGWGHQEPTDRIQHQAATLRLLQQELPEPWGLVSGLGEYLPLCREQGLLPKTVFLPYGVIEGEPSYPATNLNLDGIRPVLRNAAGYEALGGVMGNVQTPLLQLPHVYFFLTSLWDASCVDRPEKEVLLELARHLHPKHQSLLAECFAALKETDPDRTETLAAQLDEIVREGRLGRPGVLGRKLFPDQGVVARSLVLQLRLRAAQERLLRAPVARADELECATLLRNHLRAYLDWDTAHGWHDLWGWQGWPLGNLSAEPRFQVLAAYLRELLGEEDAVTAFFESVGRELAAEHDPQRVRSACIEPMQNAVLAARRIATLAQKARATASIEPNPERYPAGAANDGFLGTLYWPGALVHDNDEWLQLTWERPQSFRKVVVYFLKHPSMVGRTIRLQQETAPGRWEDLATAVIPDDPAAHHAVATFQLPAPVALDRIRVANLLDLFEIEVE